MTFEPFTYKGHHVRRGRHARSANRVEVYKGAKNKRLTDEDAIYVVSSPQAARTLIDAMVAHKEAVWNAHRKFQEFREQLEKEDWLDWFRFRPSESGGPLTDDDEEQ